VRNSSQLLSETSVPESPRKQFFKDVVFPRFWWFSPLALRSVSAHLLGDLGNTSRRLPGYSDSKIYGLDPSFLSSRTRAGGRRCMVLKTHVLSSLVWRSPSQGIFPAKGLNRASDSVECPSRATRGGRLYRHSSPYLIIVGQKISTSCLLRPLCFDRTLHRYVQDYLNSVLISLKTCKFFVIFPGTFQ
jgi:hypothetical protein